MGKYGPKIFAIIALALAIILISILKSARISGRSNTPDRVTDIQDNRSLRENLHPKSGDSNQFYLDSIKTLETYYRAQLGRLLIQSRGDSTRLFSDSIRKLELYCQSLADSLKAVQMPEIVSDSLAPAKEPSHDAVVEKLLFEFDSLSATLPRSLPVRDRELAVTGFCMQLSQKFNITPDSLQKIMQNRH